MTYRNRQIVSVQTPSCQDNDAIPLIPLRILLINTKVPKNTKVQVANVRTLVNLLPSITDRILDAMDEVAINCLETLSLLSDIKPENVKQNNNSKGNEKDNSSLQLYNKLEVSTLRFLLNRLFEYNLIIAIIFCFYAVSDKTIYDKEYQTFIPIPIK